MWEASEEHPHLSIHSPILVRILRGKRGQYYRAHFCSIWGPEERCKVIRGERPFEGHVQLILSLGITTCNYEISKKLDSHSA